MSDQGNLVTAQIILDTDVGLVIELGIPGCIAYCVRTWLYSDVSHHHPGWSYPTCDCPSRSTSASYELSVTSKMTMPRKTMQYRKNPTSPDRPPSIRAFASAAAALCECARHSSHTTRDPYGTTDLYWLLSFSRSCFLSALALISLCSPVHQDHTSANYPLVR